MNKAEIVNLLSGSAMSDEDLFAAARSSRSAVYQDRVVVRGVIELTNTCRVNCTFCPMRRDNTRDNVPYILDEEVLIGAAKIIRDSGINVILIQGGEIPQTTAILEHAIPIIISLFDGCVEILLNLGNKSRLEFERLRSAGAYSYILKHETANAELYQQLKYESLDQRLRCMQDLFDLGYKVGTGSIIGLPGQSVADLADDIILARTLGAHMVSASPLVPAPNTPLAGQPPGPVPLTLRSIAVTRLLLPDALIPAVSALEANQIGGQNVGLHAGANVMTVNFTPAGHQSEYLIYGTNRYIVKLQHVKDLLRNNGLRMSSSKWISPQRPFRAANGEADVPNDCNMAS